MKMKKRKKRIMKESKDKANEIKWMKKREE